MCHEEKRKKNVTSSAKYVFSSCKRNNLTQRLNAHVQYIYYKYVFLLLQKNRNLTHPHNTVKVKNTRNVRGRKEETMVYDERWLFENLRTVFFCFLHIRRLGHAVSCGISYFLWLKKNKFFILFIHKEKKLDRAKNLKKIEKRNDDERWFLWQSAEGAPHTCNMPDPIVCVCVVTVTPATRKEQSTSDCRPSWLCARFFTGWWISLRDSFGTVDSFEYWPRNRDGHFWIFTRTSAKKNNNNRQNGLEMCVPWYVFFVFLFFFHVYSSKQKRRLVFFLLRKLFIKITTYSATYTVPQHRIIIFRLISVSVFFCFVLLLGWKRPLHHPELRFHRISFERVRKQVSHFFLSAALSHRVHRLRKKLYKTHLF